MSSREAALDTALVSRAQEGDRGAFGELVERYQKRVYSVAYGIMRNRDDAWDVAQEAFVKAYRNIHRFEGESAFFTWLYRITYNLSIDHIRAKGRRDVKLVDENRELENALQQEGKATSGVNPAERADRVELSSILHQAMGKLSENHRAVIVLREVEGLSYEEIADVLGVKKGTIMSRLFHARKNLQTILAPYVQTGELSIDERELSAEGA
ncbi:MAG: sigma-70 family RNA polymerase sigma factor [Myxococcales bacterium]|nr:sigma-70 family RNA polymerase sigma factor [Myxococcales bacterium]